MSKVFFALLLSVAMLSTSCTSSRIKRSANVPSSIEEREVPLAIQSAEAALAAGHPQEALDWMRVALDLNYMPSGERERVQQLLERSADEFIRQLGSEDRDPAVLADILDLGLPRQIAVTGAIQAAFMYVQAGEYVEAKDLIVEVDKQYPTHHLRPEAGQLLVEAGLRLSEDESGWWIFTKRDDAFSTLEYASIQYPGADGGDLVLRRLAEMYEEDKRWALAIDRHEELVQSFPTSPLVPFSLARIPHLRLASIESVEYDRNALKEASKELKAWLESYPSHEAREDVERDLADALARLGRSDLVIARFYRRVDEPFGQRYHATRALAETLQAGDEEGRKQAQALLDELPAIEELP